MKENWKPIKNYENNYLISDKGNIIMLEREWLSNHNVKHFHKKKYMTSWVSGGYKTVDLCNNGKIETKKIHRLVLETFNPCNTPILECNHKNGNKLDNRLNNLEWVTHQENIKHSRQMKLQVKSNDVKVKCIQNNKIYKNQTEAAIELKICACHISDVLYKRRKQAGKGFTFKRI